MKHRLFYKPKKLEKDFIFDTPKTKITIAKIIKNKKIENTDDILNIVRSFLTVDRINFIESKTKALTEKDYLDLARKLSEYVTSSSANDLDHYLQKGTIANGKCLEKVLINSF